MIFRQALVADIAQIQVVRNAVKENMLTDPALVPDTDVKDYITRRGRGWVCEMNGLITGFSIVSVIDRNVWALFIDPRFEGMGIGRKLHDDMMDWYFSQADYTVWLSTSPGTRAERFYRNAGWREAGIYGKGEIKFEMTPDEWKGRKSNLH